MADAKLCSEGHVIEESAEKCTRCGGLPVDKEAIAVAAEEVEAEAKVAQEEASAEVPSEAEALVEEAAAPEAEVVPEAVAESVDAEALSDEAIVEGTDEVQG